MTESATRPSNIRLLFAVHFFVGSVVLFKAAWLASGPVLRILGLDLIAVSLNEFFGDYQYVPDKPRALIAYVISILALFIYYGAASLYFRLCCAHLPDVVRRIALSKVSLIRYAVIGLAFNLAVFVLLGKVSLIVDAGLLSIWLMWLLSPGLPHLWQQWQLARLPCARFAKGVAFGLTVAIAAHFSLVFGRLALEGPQVPNEYWDLPGQTRLQSGLVDNHQFINDRGIGGITKYDPRTDHGIAPLPRWGSYARITHPSPVLERFINAKADKASRFDLPRRLRLYVDPQRHLLVLNGPLLRGELSELRGILPVDSIRLTQTALEVQEKADTVRTKLYSDDEIEFIRKNGLELSQQVKAGWFFHHHSYMLDPLYRYTSGTDVRDLSAQYGALNVVLLAGMSKIFADAPSFNSYFAALNLSYVFYILTLLLAALVIFRDYRVVAVVVSVAAGGILMLGHELIVSAPGFSPLRHLADVPLILFAYLYSKNGRPTYLFVAASLAVWAAMSSGTFGAVLALAFSISLLLRPYCSHAIPWPRKVVEYGVAVALVVVIALAASLWPSDPVTKYYLVGAASPLIDKTTLYALLFMVSGLYASLLALPKFVTHPLSWVSILVFLYCQGMLIYYVWYPQSHHLLALAPIWAVLVGIAVVISTDLISVAEKTRNAIINAILLIGLMAYVPASARYYIEKSIAQRNINDHKAHRWDFPYFGITTTIDPTLFRESAALIQKYAGRDPGVYLISKYDNVLPYLVGKYNEMPFVTLAPNLVSDAEINRVAAALLTSRPRYLFVDSDIMRSLNGEVFTDKHPAFSRTLFGESFARVMVLYNLRKVFASVDTVYKMRESGRLVSVYERIQ